MMDKALNLVKNKMQRIEYNKKVNNKNMSINCYLQQMLEMQNLKIKMNRLMIQSYKKKNQKIKTNKLKQSMKN